MFQITRRELAAASAVAAVTASTPLLAKPAARRAPPPDATAMATAIRHRQLSAVEAVDMAIKRAEAAQPKLNFMVTPMFERARAEAKAGGQTGPFAGVPFLVKDLNDVKGVPTYSGSRSSGDAPPAPAQDVYIDSFQRAGLIFIGKSATPEFGFLPTTEPLRFGPTHNPWNLDHSAGGSSGGSAAAVAAGVVPFAHANDGGGSIRIPAACCGLVGLKPSRGRLLAAIPGRSVTDIAVDHCVSRSVRDSAALFAATEATGAASLYAPIGFVGGPNKRRLRIGLLLEGTGKAKLDPDVQAGVEATAKLLTGLGHSVRPTAWPFDGPQFIKDFLTFWASGAAQLANGIGKARGKPADETVLEPFSLGMAKMVSNMTQAEFGVVIGRLTANAQAYDAWFNDFDVVLSPVLTTPAPLLGYVGPSVPFDELVARLIAYVGFTPIENVSGGPAISLPLHMSHDGLPVGVQFAARAGGERTLYELAYELEAARPWASRRPPVWFGD